MAGAALPAAGRGDAGELSSDGDVSSEVKDGMDSKACRIAFM